MTIAVLMATSMGALLAQHLWFCDLLANLRVQQCLSLVPVLSICLLVQQWRWAAIAGFCLLLHLPWFLDAFREGVRVRNSDTPTSDGLTVTMANVLTSNLRFDDILADAIQNRPDVLVILELSHGLADRLVKEIGPEYPHAIAKPMDDGNFGIGMYSRHPFIASEVFKLNTEVESIEATIDIRGRAHRIIATHPLPPIGDRGFKLRNDHLHEMARRIGFIDGGMTPSILVGDLNVTPWSPHFRSLIDKTGLRRAVDGFDATPTWYRIPRYPFGLTLDHALISTNLECVEHIVGPDIGSDHRSVTVKINSRLR